MGGPAPDLVAVGHLARDRTPTGVRLGGAVAYAGLTAHRLGLRVGVVASARPAGDLPAHLPGLALHILPSPQDTVFEHRPMPGGGRRLRLLSRALSLGPEQVPEGWRTAPLALLAPIAREVEPRTALAFPQARVALAPQGWLRAWDGDTGEVRPAHWPEAPVLLRRCALAVVSEEDLPDPSVERAWARLCPLLVVTRGERGATLYLKGEAHPIPPVPARREADPTGAGDVFACAFLVRWWETGDPFEAGHFASCAGALKVEREGLEGVPTRAEIEARLSALL